MALERPHRHYETPNWENAKHFLNVQLRGGVKRVTVRKIFHLMDFLSTYVPKPTAYPTQANINSIGLPQLARSGTKLSVELASNVVVDSRFFD